MSLGRKFAIRTIAVVITYLMAITAVWSHCVDDASWVQSARMDARVAMESQSWSCYPSADADTHDDHENGADGCVQIAWNKSETISAASVEAAPRVQTVLWLNSAENNLWTLPAQMKSPPPPWKRRPPLVRRSLVALKTLLLN